MDSDDATQANFGPSTWKVAGQVGAFAVAPLTLVASNLLGVLEWSPLSKQVGAWLDPVSAAKALLLLLALTIGLLGALGICLWRYGRLLRAAEDFKAKKPRKVSLTGWNRR